MGNPLVELIETCQGELRSQARALRSTGLSQTAIARKMMVPRRTIADWLKNHTGGLRQLPQNGEPRLSNSPPPRYLVVPGSVELFRPPDGVAFPLIIADPPWNVSDPGHKRERKVRPNRPFTKDFGLWDAFESDRAYQVQCQQWLQALYDVAAPDAWLFFWCSYLYASGILGEAERAGWRRHNFYTWHKVNPLPMFGNNNFLQSMELALVLAKGKPHFDWGPKKGQPHNYFESPQVGGLERVKNSDGGATNMAQKPLSLTSLWVEWGSRPGDWVLDAFAGTGTVTVAALALGRNACAVEQDPAQAHQIEARVLRESQGAIPYA